MTSYQTLEEEEFVNDVDRNKISPYIKKIDFDLLWRHIVCEFLGTAIFIYIGTSAATAGLDNLTV